MANCLKNISLKTFRDYLEWKGCKKIRTKGGHEIWSHHDLNRPIVLQAHINPVPEFIARQIIRTPGVNQDDFIKFLKS
jgi:predicted RNA binding protein YcfA (HicA-like mRNA interferase family)